MNRTLSFYIRSFFGRIIRSFCNAGFGEIKPCLGVRYYNFLGFGACAWDRNGELMVQSVSRTVTKREFPSA